MSPNSTFIKPFIELGKKLAFRYTPLAVPRYRYNLEPIELATLIFEIERLADVDGCIVEIGVARGLTTRFLAEHIVLSGRRERIIAIDTFSSFTDADVMYETQQRRKRRSEIQGFGYNDYTTWVRNFRPYSFIQAIQADCTNVDYRSLSPIKLVLLDVDLYSPTKKTLPLLFDSLASGGTILVDDVKRGTAYDGAYQAYFEFCSEAGLEPLVIGTKCGVIRK